MADKVERARLIETLRYYPRSKITSWEGWPDDVRPLLREWNKAHELTFIRVNDVIGEARLFRCYGCQKWYMPPTNGVAVYDTCAYCDDCMIAVARAALRKDAGVMDDKVERARHIETIRAALTAGPDASEWAYAEATHALDALAAELDAAGSAKECVCGEINTRHCPVHASAGETHQLWCCTFEDKAAMDENHESHHGASS